jgi:hypothetical protein
MAGKSRKLDANARTWLTLVIVMLLSTPIILVRSCVATKLDEDRIVISPSIDDRLVSFKNGTTMVLEPGSMGFKIANWLKVGTTTTHRFSIGDEVFAPGSAKPSNEGAHRVALFAQMMEAHPELSTRIFVTKAKGTEIAAENRLEHQRAEELRRQVIALGVAEDKIEVVAQPLEVQTRKASEHPRLLIVLEKSRG